MATYHLPKLLNPLINSIFNCPDINNSSLKNLYAKLSDLNHFLVIVPPTDSLLTLFDESEKLTLEERCYNEDFISNYIIIPKNNKTKQRFTSDNCLFQTLNGKDIIIQQKLNLVITSNGFDCQRKHHILKFDSIPNFTDAYSTNNTPWLKKFVLIYIDRPLITGKQNDLIRRKELECFNHNSNEHSYFEKQDGHKQHNTDDIDIKSFENMLHSRSDWVQQLDTLFRLFKTEVEHHPEKLRNKFEEINYEISRILRNFTTFKDVKNLDNLIRTYSEINLHDYIWKLITERIRSTYGGYDEHFQYLYLAQLDTEFYKELFPDFRLSYIVKLEKNVTEATAMLSKLSMSNTHSKKCEILVKTLQILSKPLKIDNSIEKVIDADTLMSLFVLIINRSNLSNVRCHLYYLQRFYKFEDDIKFGLLGYAISTMEAAITYLNSLYQDKEKSDVMKENDDNIKKLIDLITSQIGLSDVSTLLDFKKYFKYRSETGQSILSLCITNYKNDIAKILLSDKKLEEYLPLDDLLEDETVDGSTLLIQSLKCSNNEIATILVEIMLNNCNENEIVDYFARKNIKQRNAGHYLSSHIYLLEKIGKYIKWDTKDINGQTPLFTILRSYDQVNYDHMVSTALKIANSWYKNEKNTSLTVTDHEDFKGNTLLHIMKDNISILMDTVSTIDVNKCNKKGMTPLMVYVKYNRIDNIRTILKDSRILVNEGVNITGIDCFDYATDDTVLRLLAIHSVNKETTFGHAFIHSLKFHQNSSYSVKITVKRSTDNLTESYKILTFNLKTIKNLFKVLLKQYPSTFLPLTDVLLRIESINEDLEGYDLRYVKRMRKITLLEYLTNCLDSIIQLGMIPSLEIFDSEIELIEWLQEQKIILRCHDNKLPSSLHKGIIGPESVTNMLNFLRFNMNELSVVKPKFIAIKKIVTFLLLKNGDISAGKFLFQYLAESFNNSLISKFMLYYSGLRVQFYDIRSLSLLLQNLDFLDGCINLLIRRTDIILNLKLPKWWKLYGELLEIRRSTKGYEDVYNNTDDEQNTNSKTKSDGNLLSNFLGNSRLKNGHAIHQHLMDSQNSLDALGKELYKGYEELAEEFSKFIRFKSQFLEFGIVKTISNANFKSLRQHIIRLEGDFKRTDSDISKNEESIKHESENYDY